MRDHRASTPQAPAGVGERRRPSLAELSFAADPRRLRELLAEFERTLASADPDLARRARVLVGEIVARVLVAGLQDEIELDLQVKPGSVRIDIWQESEGPCEFWDRLGESGFASLSSAWGRDRRRPCGIWFEIDGDTLA